MYRLSWAIALAFTLAMLAGILVVTRDLNTTNSIFKDGVVQAKKVNATTDKAVDATGELPPANQAIDTSMPHVGEILGQLGRAQTTLGSLGNQLDTLGGTLRGADAPLVGIINAVDGATKRAGGIPAPAAHIVRTLTDAQGKLRTLAPMLDETDTHARNIESKLHVLTLLPKLGG